MKSYNNDRQLLLQLVEAISPDTFLEISSGQAAIDYDNMLIEHLVDQPQGVRKLRIWENRNCLVTTKRMARQKWFAKAAEQSAKRGWPVYVRSTGGTTVVHRPGILNVSLSNVSKLTNVRPNDTYQELAKLLIGALEKMGIKATCGYVQNSYCDGRYNICFDGRKMAGTASRILRRNGKTLYLCHASLVIYGSVFLDVELVRQFESHAGTMSDIRLDRHISVKSVLRQG